MTYVVEDHQSKQCNEPLNLGGEQSILWNWEGGLCCHSPVILLIAAKAKSVTHGADKELGNSRIQ